MPSAALNAVTLTDVLFPALGAALLAVLFYDVLITVFHPQGQGGPLSRAQNTAVWALFRALARRLGGGNRKRVLAFCGPLMAVLTIGTWGLAQVIGFALIYYPWMQDFLVSPGKIGPSWAAALYYSGYVGSTLGIGDVLAPTSTLRLLTVAEAWSGFVLIPVSITYVLSVYRELGNAATLSLSLSGFFRHGPEAVRKRLRRPWDHDVAVWARDTASELLHITQAHSQYPILHYFHSKEREQAVLVQLGHVVDLLWNTDEPIASAAGDHSPGFDTLQMAVESHLHVLDRDIVPEGYPPEEAGDENAPIPLKYRRILDYMLYDPPETQRDSHEET